MASCRSTWLAFHAVVRHSLGVPNSTRSFGHSSLMTLRTACRHHSAPPTLRIRSISQARRYSDDVNDRDHESQKRRNPSAKSKGSRASLNVASTSLRRVAVEAQRSSRKLIKGTGKRSYVDPKIPTKDVTAYCVAERYDLAGARKLLEAEGYTADPLETGLFPQVLHIQTPSYIAKNTSTGLDEAQGVGDIFVFPSGSLVAWNVPDGVVNPMLHRILPPAAEHGHLERLEMEDLQYLEDETRDVSRIIGDTIILGYKTEEDADSSKAEDGASTQLLQDESHDVDRILAKIAFSSALARSAKLAVLEESLDRYFESTRTIPATLSSGRKLRLTRAFLLRKTGELLNIRAQLNLYSELTDSLPDIFWDSPYELGLENYYDMVGRALDVHVRIKTLNDRMDYAGEIAQVLRERLSEKHSTGLEWLIIGLISIEVAFGILHLWRERSEQLNPDSTKALLNQWLERALREEASER